MHHSIFSVEALALALAVVTVDAANKTCGTSGQSWDIGSQADADKLLGGCTDLQGTVHILSSYSGALNLSGVTFMNEFHSDRDAGITDVNIDNVTDVKTFTVLGSGLQTLHFPALTEAGSISLNSTVPLNLDLPEIVNISDIEIYGQLESISMPVLQQIGSSQITVSSTGTINLMLPALETLGNESFTGPFENISFPSLTSVVDIEIYCSSSSVACQISMPKLQNATVISVGGRALTLDIPSLEYLTGAINISSDASLNCIQARDAYLSTHSDPDPQAPRKATFSCDSATGSQHMSKMGLGLGVGLGVPAGLFVLYLIWWVAQRSIRKIEAEGGNKQVFPTLPNMKAF